MTQKKTILLIVIILMSSMYLSAFAYDLDGDLSDWGVTPFADWAPDSSTAYYVEEDNTGNAQTRSYNGESYDFEALYFDKDNDYYYWAIVKSYRQDWAADLVIGVPSGSGYEYKHAVDLTPFGAYLTENGLTQTAFAGNVTSWTLSTSTYDNLPVTCRQGYSYMHCEVPVDGACDTFYRIYDANNTDPTSWPAGEIPTYILEGRIDRALIHNAFLAYGKTDDFTMDNLSFRLLHVGGTCYSDALILDIDGNPAVPEPAALILFGSGIFGFAIGRLRRKV